MTQSKWNVKKINMMFAELSEILLFLRVFNIIINIVIAFWFDVTGR